MRLTPRPFSFIKNRRLLLAGLGAAILLLITLTLWKDITDLFSREATPVTLEMDLLTDTTSEARVYWRTDGPYREDWSSKRRVSAAAGWQRVVFPIRGYPLEGLRFDPLTQEGRVWIRNVRVRSLEGRTLAVIDPAALIPRQEIAAIERGPDQSAVVTMTEGARDPQLLIPLDYPFQNAIGRPGQVLRAGLYLGLAGAGGLLALMVGSLVSWRRLSTYAGVLLTLWLVGLTHHWAYDWRLFVIPMPATVWVFLAVGTWLYPMIRLAAWVGEQIPPPKTTATNQVPDPGARLARIFLLLGIPFGGTFVFLTPPYQAPDEGIWMYRIYDVSEGNLYPRLFIFEDEDGNSYVEAGAMLPMTGIIQHWKQTGGVELPFHPDRRISPGTIQRSWYLEWDAEDRTFRTLTNTLHSFPPYLPQAVGMALARASGLPFTAQFYAGRLANWLVFMGLGYLALRCAPHLRWFCLVVLLAPMSLFLSASLSHDPLVIALAVLLLALILRLREQAFPIQRGQLCVLLGLIFLVLVSKFNYLVLLPLTLLLPVSQFAHRRAYWRSQGLLWGCSLLGLVGLLTAVYYLPPGDWGRPEVDRSQRLVEILATPLHYAGFILNSVAETYREQIRQMSGVLGWLDTDIGSFFRWLWGSVLGMALIADGRSSWRNPLTLPERCGLFLGGVLGVISIYGIFLITWTLASDSVVAGVQGRYFLPFLPLFGLACLFRTQADARCQLYWERTLIVLLGLVLTGTALALLYRYWIPVG